ncbi:MAG: T9SS C-terminal target domain-containing protein [Balneolaceae bacterium]|nr:MAG: T9SS C-terminal target domain-containing protein [Balneolaceae bacterium]
MKRAITNKSLVPTWTLCVALALLIVSAGFQTVQAQEKTRITVEPDNFPLEIGALNRAIEANGGDVIYVLRNGKTYFTDAILAPNHLLHIEAEEYPSNNPPVIRVGTDLLGSGRNLSRYRDDVIMRGIMFTGIDDLGGKQQNQRTAVQDIHLHYQHCYFMASLNYMWQFYGTGTSLRLEDSFVANHGRHTSQPNQRLIDVRGFDTDSLIVINTSAYQLAAHIIRAGGARISNVYFDHVTIVNHQGRSNMELHIADNVTIKNSLFHNVGLNGVWEAASVVGDAGAAFDGPYYANRAGVIFIREYAEIFGDDEEAPKDSDRRFVIKNNNFGGLPDQEYLDLYEEMNQENPHITDPAWRWANPDIDTDNPIWALRDTIPAVRIVRPPMDSTLLAWARNEEPWVTIENNIRERVTINEMPSSIINSLRADLFGLDNTPHFDYWDELNNDGDARFYHFGEGNPVNTGGPTAAWYRDLGYNSDSQSFTHAENGYPVGNLNYYPELRERWGLGEVITSVDEPQEVASSYRIVGNYPNPFNPTTSIVFELASATDVTLGVYNILGQRVATMPLGLQNAGEHQVNFDASQLSSGIYLVRMQIGADVQSPTHFMTLIK